MTQDTIKTQLADLDKKLDVLINSVNHENKAMLAFRDKTEAAIAGLLERVRAVEIENAANSTNQEDFKTVKSSIIRIVVSSMFGIVSVAGIMAAVIIKMG